MVCWVNIVCQTNIVPMFSTFMSIRKNEYISFKNGLSPSIQVEFGKSNHKTRIKFQNVWWRTSNPYIDRLQSSLMGLEYCYYMDFNRTKFGAFFGLSYLWNHIRFKSSPFEQHYESDFKWQNIAYDLGLDFVLKNNMNFKLIYSAMHPTQELPFYKFGFVQFAIGYKISIKKAERS